MKKIILSIFFVFLFIGAQAQNKYSEQINSIKGSYDQEKLTELYTQFSERDKLRKEEVIRYALLNNIPIRFEDDFGVLKELQYISEEGNPIYYTTFNSNAAISTRANYLNSGGGLGLSLNGDDLTAHVWDAGLARTTHQEYDGAGGTNRFSIGDGTTALHYHSAHVTGTIMASGVQAAAKGMAWQADAVGYDWNSDVSEATTAAGNGMLVSNHSYGYVASSLPDDQFGQYWVDARDWDDLMYNAPYYLMMVAAGNDGNDNSSNGQPLDGNSSYDKLSGHATAKNNLVVANGQDANINGDGSLNFVNINTGSSEGPTDDYRIKPDITGNGTSLYSTYEGSDTEYASISGTSMASPNVTGTLLLLQEHYNNLNSNFMRAATLKGLALHTADDAGPNGPDVVYGWGLLNAKKAAETLTTAAAGSGSAIVDELTLNQGNSYQIVVQSNGTDPLMASISWTDPAGTINGGTNSNTPALVNDLDIRLDNGATFTPWRLTSITTNGAGDNVVDPYERIDVNGASGQYTLTVTHKGGTLSGGSQNFSLIVTGIVVSSTPVISFASIAGTTSEDTNCSFTDIDVTLNIGQAPSANADVTFSVNGGSTATSTLDFEILTPSVIFLAGQTASKTMTLRVYHDGFVEVDETAIIDFTVNANGGDATADANADTFTLTINDDDVAPIASQNTSVLFEDFEDITGWTVIDNDGDTEQWGIFNPFAHGNLTGLWAGSVTDLAVVGGSGVLTPDNFISSPEFIIPVDATNTQFTFEIGDFGNPEHYAVYFSTDKSSAANIISGTLIEERNTIGSDTETRVVNVSTLAGQTGYFSIRHYNTTGNSLLMLDTIDVTVTTGTPVQTAVNTGVTNDSQDLASSGTIYTSDSATGNVMLDVTNNQSDDYGCIDFSVSRAGTGAQSYNGSVSPDFVMDKTFRLSPTNSVGSGDASVMFYFTEAEISGWESATGSSRNSLIVGREVGGAITEVSSLTIGAFGTNVTLTGTFTDLDGDFYFGTSTVIILGTCGGGTNTWNGSNWSLGSPSINQNVVINGDYNTSLNGGSINACTLTVNSGFTLNITELNYLNVDTDITVDGTINVLNNGSLVQIDDLAAVTKGGSGTITVEKITPSINDRGFTILGSPMSGETTGGVYTSAAFVRYHDTDLFTPNTAVAIFDPGAENFADEEGDNWVAYTGALTVGEGYLVKPYTIGSGTNSPFTTDYTLGTLNNGVITFTTKYNTGGTAEENQNASPNILSNPYASAIDAFVFITDNALLVDAIYYWEHITAPNASYPGYRANNYDMGDISMYNLTGGMSAANEQAGAPVAKPSNQFIPSGQGFGVKAIAQGDVTFDNSMRLTGNNNGYRNSETIIDRLYLGISNDAYELKSGTLIGFTELATDGFDRNYDAKRLATPVSLYSLNSDRELGIQGRSVFNLDHIIPLGFSTQVEENQEYTISISSIEGALISEATIYLQDNLLGTVTNLSETDYTFNANVGHQTDRFVIVFTEEVLGSNDLSINAISLYPNPTNSILNIVSPLFKITGVVVYDVQGRIISEAKVRNLSNYQLNLENVNSAMYFIKIRTENGSVIKRVVKD